MIYCDGYVATNDTKRKTDIVTAKIAGKQRCFRVVVTKVYGKDTVWLKSGSEDSMYYVVGIQSDGSIVRAEGLGGTGFPSDPRCSSGQVVIKRAGEGEVVKYLDDIDWSKAKEVQWIVAEIAGEERKFWVNVTKVNKKDRVWIMSQWNGNVCFLVGIQSDGSIVRARGLAYTGLPLDPRCGGQKLVIRKQLQGGEDGSK